MTNFDTPVLLIAFNRLYTLEKLLPQLRQVKPSQLYFAVDAHRVYIPGEKEKTDCVKKYVLDNIDWLCTVKTLFGADNLGTKYGIAKAIKWFFSNVEQGIVLEDDCLPSTSFFYFCQELLEKYKNDSRIGMISGFNRFDNYHCKASYHFSTGGPIWGYASWKRVGDAYDVDHKLFRSPKLKRYLLDATSDSRETELLDQRIRGVLDGRVKSWDFSWGVLQKINSQIAIVPARNMVINTGLGRDAMHYDPNNEKLGFIQSHEIDFPLIHPECIIADRQFSKMLAAPLYLSRILELYSKLPLVGKCYRALKRTACYPWHFLQGIKKQ